MRDIGGEKRTFSPYAYKLRKQNVSLLQINCFDLTLKHVNGICQTLKTEENTSYATRKTY